MVPILAISTLGWLVLACVWIALAFWPARVAGRKGHSFIGYFIFGVFMWPVAVVVAYMIDDRNVNAA